MRKRGIGLVFVLVLSLLMTSTIVAANNSYVQNQGIQPFAIDPPTQLESTGHLRTNHSGTINFTYSPFYFQTSPSKISQISVESETNVRLEIYGDNGHYLYYVDAVKIGKYYIITTYLPQSTSTFYYILVNMHGTGTSMIESYVDVWHKTQNTPTQLAPSTSYNSWTHDGANYFSYSPYYFKSSTVMGNAELVATANTNFRIEYYSPLNHHYLGQQDAILINGVYTIKTNFSPFYPDFYISLVNMHGYGTKVQGNMMSITYK